MTDTHAEYRMTVQRAADTNDPRGTAELTGTNFSDMVQQAQASGYARVISADERQVTEWSPVDYPFDEATP